MGVAGVLGAVIGSLAALFVLIVIGAVLFGRGSSSDTSPVAIPTYESSQSPTDESVPTRTRREETTEPTREPEQERPTTQETDTGDDSTATTAPTLNTSLKNNTMYRAGALPRVNCPGGNANIFNHAQLKALILKTGACMDRSWRTILTKQGIPFSPPRWAIVAKRGRGACGDYPQPGTVVPYYCPRNNTIYVSTSATVRGNGTFMGYGQLVTWNGGITSLMAHEYGHHVQNITGLMNSWWDSSLESSRSGKLALSRRLELQATCFGGMWMRSVQATYPVSAANRNQLFWLYSRVGDGRGYPRDHGTPANNNLWFRQGWNKNRTYQCNTWLAPSSTTS